MSSIRGIPFTEVVERVDNLGRTGADIRQRLRGIINEVYTLDIPNSYDYYWLKAHSAISCVAEYNTGVVSVNTQSTTCTFGSGPTITSSFTGRKIKFNDNPDVYDITYNSATSVTIDPPLSGESNISSGSYTIYKSIYSLPSNFDRFPVNGGLLFYSGGQPTPLPQLVDDDYYAQVNASPSSTPDSCRFREYDTAGCLTVEIIPPPASPYILRDEYIKALLPMVETTAGTIVATAGSNAITGTGTLFTEMNTGDYIRADLFGKSADSTWYRIQTISSNSDLTVSPVFKSSSGYSGVYTICSMPQMPYRMHPALIWGSLAKVLPDQKDPMLFSAKTEYAKILTDNKILERSRYAKDNIELMAEDPNYRF